jgi:hypothetical protein
MGVISGLGINSNDIINRNKIKQRILMLQSLKIMNFKCPLANKVRSSHHKRVE